MKNYPERITKPGKFTYVAFEEAIQAYYKLQVIEDKIEKGEIIDLREGLKNLSPETAKALGEACGQVLREFIEGLNSTR